MSDDIWGGLSTDRQGPDLFLALRDIKDPRRRTRRLKDLAVKGVLMERAPTLIGSGAPAREPEMRGPRAVVGESVSAMLDWEGSTAASACKGSP